MSAQEERQQIIRENLPKLIENLTRFSRDEENFKRCEQFAWYTFKNHRNLSVNSHEIKRKIDGMLEKFIVGNYQQYANYLKNMYNELINHPLCLSHYEVDVQWAILEFLLCLSYNPVGSLKRNKLQIPLPCSDSGHQSPVNDFEYWGKILKEDCIPLNKENYEADSELSDWSESDSEKSSSRKDVVETNKSLERATKKTFQNIDPPKKSDNYKLFDRSISKQWLIENIQNTWWLEKNFQCEIESSREGAQFCQFWIKYLADKSNNLIKLKKISIVSEYCLLREIVWMFQYPTTNKFFTLDGDNIFVRENVSISSVTLEGVRYWLESIIPYMKMANTLQKFISSVYYYNEIAPPKVYEYYAPSLKDILQSFYDDLLSQEEKIQKQAAFQINTLIQFQHNMQNSFEFLEKIYNIHTFAALYYKVNSAHICSAHLLAGLLHKFEFACCTVTSNMAVSLFLSSVQAFCNIIDYWWLEGRLDDWRNEFLVERTSNENEEICARPFAKSREKAFFVPGSVSKIIEGDSFLKLLMEHSLEAGCTLNLLYRINKIGDLKNANNFEKSLYESFLEEVLSNVERFQDKELSIANIVNKENESDKETSNENDLSIINDFVTNVSFDDKFLFMVFSSNLKVDCDDTEKQKSDKSLGNKMNTLDIFKKLNGTSKIIIPMIEVITKCLSNILQNRIALANKFVMTMYHDEFEVLRHLQNIKRVLLLEASDLMHYFYIKLFAQIESGKSWANPFLLTVQLDDIMCSKFPDVSSLFHIEIKSNFKSQTVKVTEAVDELIVKYDIRKELENIISEECMEDYNKVFRFLLKIKWGIWTLENLRFPTAHKKRLPYAEFTMNDLHMRRLQQLRFWLMYAIYNIHFHLGTHVLQSMGQQLEKKIQNCTNLIEIKSVHESYIKKLCEYCFVEKDSSYIKIGIEQLLSLINVLKLEWQNFDIEIENSSDESDSGETYSNLISNSQMEGIESTYIRCHQYLAKTLNNEVYIKQNTHLSGLSAAFNTSIPY